MCFYLGLKDCVTRWERNFHLHESQLSRGLQWCCVCFILYHESTGTNGDEEWVNEEIQVHRHQMKSLHKVQKFINSWRLKRVFHENQSKRNKMWVRSLYLASTTIVTDCQWLPGTVCIMVRALGSWFRQARIKPITRVNNPVIELFSIYVSMLLSSFIFMCMVTCVHVCTCVPFGMTRGDTF